MSQNGFFLTSGLSNSINVQSLDTKKNNLFKFNLIKNKEKNTCNGSQELEKHIELEKFKYGLSEKKEKISRVYTKKKYH